MVSVNIAATGSVVAVDTDEDEGIGERNKNDLSNTERRVGVLKKGNRWKATCCTRYLGMFGDQNEAARAYDEEMRKIRPNGRRQLNFPTLNIAEVSESAGQTKPKPVVEQKSSHPATRRTDMPELTRDLERFHKWLKRHFSTSAAGQYKCAVRRVLIAPEDYGLRPTT
eukprot:SAG11_NODE_1493_length_4805_cov_14.583510_7_plen_167_part_01